MLTFNGYLYSTLRDVPVNVNQVTSQTYFGYYSLPSGWRIANDTSDSRAVTMYHYWSTESMVFSNGNAYRTLNGNSCWGGGCAGASRGSGWLLQYGTTYNINSLWGQILITSQYILCSLLMYSNNILIARLMLL